MEDEDVKGKVMDAQPAKEEQKAQQRDESLKRPSSVLSSNLSEIETTIEESKDEKCGVENTDDSKIVFKGFKKRILAQSQENQQNSHGKVVREKRTNAEGKRGKITEYAQYLGLQPAPLTKTKCSRCNTSLNSTTSSMVKQQPCTCPTGPQSPSTSDAIIPTSPSSAPTGANNFRITRKVYLCSACGTYFENWNLFLHMREIHKRHICLFCLGMFGQADRLSHHLTKKHSVTATSFTSVEDFYNAFKGPCYLICCTCEKVFSETDNFYNHFCSPIQKGRSNEVCSACRQTGSHSSTCENFAIPGIHGKPTPDGITGIRSTSKRILKNNRIKRNEKSMLVSHQQKISDVYGEKMNMKVDDEIVSVSGNLETTTTDTVAETIMEVSKYMEDLRRNQNIEKTVNDSNVSPIKIESSPSPSPSLSLPNQQIETNLYDSVSETIMQVSRCSENSQRSSDVLINDEMAQLPNDPESTNGKDDYDDRLKDSDSEEICNTSGSSIHDRASPVKESQTTSVSFPTDRSLVIKICTNRNSQFSVSYSNENHESEENNNAEDSISDRESLASQEEQSDAEIVNEQSIKIDEKIDDTGILTFPLPNETTEDKPEEPKSKIAVREESDGIILATEDVPTIDLIIEGTLDSMEIDELLKRCISAAAMYCVYCNHARKIAVNGKQLGLHVLAEHRFLPQHPAIIIQREQFTERIKKSLTEVSERFFNLDTFDTKCGTYDFPQPRVFECFNCRYHSNVHKEVYMHHRKMHQKTILICIMCKSTFYSYSELLCHLCPGVYSPNINLTYRCCLCPLSNLPSAFRLMVHLRKRHHTCDVCLESTGNQQRLSNHVWKHKLHHLCYRCGIAYRNKPDITKHLFWKHGTESVLCKKCLQKKWPHVYHFCIPPTAFVCEECTCTFSRAVALKVHKRLHTGDCPYPCYECDDAFISRKLLSKHEVTHREPEKQPEVPCEENLRVIEDIGIIEKERPVTPGTSEKFVEPPCEETKEPPKKVVDVYDLPPLNLSSESDTDSDDGDKKETIVPKETVEMPPTTPTEVISPLESSDTVPEVELIEEAKIMDGIWDNFKSYAASLENPVIDPELEAKQRLEFLCQVILEDHDYWIVTDKTGKELKEENTKLEEKIIADETENVDKSPVSNCETPKKEKTPKKKKQNGCDSSSDSSTDSDSSSCSCGENCSCSSSSSDSSSSSSSSSDSDSSASDGSPKKQRKERRKDKEISEVAKMEIIEEAPENVAIIDVESQADVLNTSIEVCEAPLQLILRESDLDTDETETDEDFYDEHPQQLANKLLEEKRNQLLLLAAVAPAVDYNTPGASPQNGVIDTINTNSATSIDGDSRYPSVKQPRKKVKTKKRKKADKNKSKNQPTVESIKLNIPKSFYENKPRVGYSSGSPAMITVLPSRSSTPSLQFEGNEVTNLVNIQGGSGSESETKRLSKRKRIPKRFYGDSSDDEAEKNQTQSSIKWRKMDNPTIVPSITIKSQPAPPPPPLPINVNYGTKSVTLRLSGFDKPMERIVPIDTVVSESDDAADSSSETSDDNDANNPQSTPQPTQLTQHQPPALHRPNPTGPTNSSGGPVNLYCYCQCPYDEVSEMIACDGNDCLIEWFHFECVGIMVPPKGKWYCPDCGKREGLPSNDESYD